MVFLLTDAAADAGKIDAAFGPVVSFLEKIFFWDPVAAIGIDAGVRIPIVVLWLILGGIYFTIRMRFVNFRAFRHSFGLIAGKYDKTGDKGEVSHFQALATALSATVGLGNIAGVAIAVTFGGPGATFWMIIAGLLGMSMKFTECTLGLKYRDIDERGRCRGGQCTTSAGD
jgi:AGCS family alanine or glycine:cation symporter